MLQSDNRSFSQKEADRTTKNRTVQSIVGKVINVLSSSDARCKFREEVSGVIKLLSEIIRKYAVLADPVYF